MKKICHRLVARQAARLWCWCLGFGLVSIPVLVGLAQEPVLGSDEGWRQAELGYAWQFPRDHGSHPAYRIEWWYYTGNLAAGDGSRFGYQVTFFRVGVDQVPVNPSRWAVRDLFMAHLAVTDIESGRQLMAERLDRAGVGWAGAQSDTLAVWNGDWAVELEGDAHRLVAVDQAFGVNLRLEAGRGVTLHGEGGLSRKGLARGNASQYYSMTRMPTSGQVRIDGVWKSVTGDSWMDHEFGTTFLEMSQVGWDWFSLQLDNGQDLMLFQLRHADGTSDPLSAGTWVEPSGEASPFGAREFTITPLRYWASRSSGAEYPVAWRIELPTWQIALEVEAVVDAQELHTDASTGVTYWEGAVVVRGLTAGQPVSGVGYLEMTGYAGRPMGEVFRD